MLDLSNNEISDAGLLHLKTLGNLEELVLLYTRISDEGLSSIYDLRRIRWLYLEGTKVTETGLRLLHDKCGLSFDDFIGRIRDD